MHAGLRTALLLAPRAPAMWVGPSLVRIVNVSSKHAWVIAPHPTLGSIAFSFREGNYNDNSTPSSSIGPPFGGYRLDGVFRLTSVAADPTVPANRIKEFSSDVGSQQTAVQILGGGGPGNLYGGVYHGGLVTTGVSGTDLLTSRYVPEFAYTSLGTVTWPDGSVAYFTDTITIRSDGRLRKSVRMVSAATFLRIYLDMVICSGAYQRARHDAETAWYSIPNNAETDMLPGRIVWSRCREDGRTIRMETNAPDVLPGPRAFIRRDAGIDRAKIYHLGVPIGPGADFTVDSIVDYSITSDFEWSAAVDGASRYTVFSGAANIVNIGGIDNLVMVRSASVINKISFNMFWFEPGTYELPRTATITGGGTAGASFVVTSAADGNITTPAPLSSLTANSAAPITFTVVTAGLYSLVINQASSAGNAGHELRIASFSQPVKIA